ncbi:uncharacterized protein LOC110854571 isoform X2 [Folsomia candida]|uniref:uncharacterized protein LOC110854571 isoform X2 n=1 Tax=Folsomia candida TaxID=158441 RepID=UPI001604BA29|nr:uncharacterized protein LOC110854571 isoform X2 [Folsomia candida]
MEQDKRNKKGNVIPNHFVFGPLIIASLLTNLVGLQGLSAHKNVEMTPAQGAIYECVRLCGYLLLIILNIVFMGFAAFLGYIDAKKNADAKKPTRDGNSFTTSQLIELEKRFLYQKQLSADDADDIARQVGLSTGQVTTWFKNRRQKLVRDMKELTEDVQACKLRQPGNWLCPEGQDPNFKRDHHTENKSAPASSSSSTSAPIPTAKGENDHAKDDQDVTVHGTQSRKQIFSCNLSEEQDRFDGYESMENKNSEIQNLENSPPTPKALIKTEEDFTCRQITELEKIYHFERFPSAKHVDQLAEKLGLTSVEVSNWFQARHQKSIRNLEKLIKGYSYRYPNRVISVETSTNKVAQPEQFSVENSTRTRIRNTNDSPNVHQKTPTIPLKQVIENLKNQQKKFSGTPQPQNSSEDLQFLTKTPYMLQKISVHQLIQDRKHRQESRGKILNIILAGSPANQQQKVGLESGQGTSQEPIYEPLQTQEILITRKNKDDKKYQDFLNSDSAKPTVVSPVALPNELRNEDPLQDSWRDCIDLEESHLEEEKVGDLNMAGNLTTTSDSGCPADCTSATILDKPTPGDANSTLKSEELPSSPTKSYVRTHLHGFNTTLTEEQLETLCSIYDANPIPNDFLKKEIQDTTGLALPLVEYWFQCRRNSDINFQTVLSQRMKQLGIGQMVNLSFRIAITLPPLNVNIDGDPVPVARRDYLRQSQLDTLRASYTTNSAQLSTDELTSLTTQTGLSGRQIWIWFYNQVTLDFKELVEKGEPVMEEAQVVEEGERTTGVDLEEDAQIVEREENITGDDDEEVAQGGGGGESTSGSDLDEGWCVVSSVGGMEKE